MNDAPDLQARLVRVHGRVQGVGYRHACTQQARSLGVRGWVRNRSDSSVEALLVGDGPLLDRMCAWMRQGPAGARVDLLDQHPAAVPTPPPQAFDAAPTL